MGKNTASNIAALLITGAFVASSGCGTKPEQAKVVDKKAAEVEAPGKVPTPPGVVEGSEIKRYDKWGKEDWSNFPSLKTGDKATAQTAAKLADAKAVLATLKPGDAARGKELANDRRAGNCISCHVMPKGDLAGNVGPSLVDYKAMGRDETWVFAQIFDSRIHNEESVMPPFGTNGIITKGGKDGQPKTADFQGIRDVAAYILSIQGKEDAPTDEIQDPAKRAAPVEDRDYLDPTVNPAMLAVENAEELFAAKGQAGKACADSGCHENPAQSLKGKAAKWPKWNAEAKKVMGIEEFIEVHAKKETGHEWKVQSDQNLAMAIYVRFLSNGMPLEVDTTSPEAAEALKRGEAMMKKKIGQLHLACVDCHVASANKWIRGQFLGPFKGQIGHFPVFRTSQSLIWDIRKRFQWCNLSVRANPLEPSAPEYGDIELYLSKESAGLKIEVPGIRH